MKKDDDVDDDDDKDGEKKDKKKTNDMFAESDMFSENYAVSVTMST